MNRVLVPLALAAVVLGTVALGGGTCARPCESSLNCKRTCDCVNTSTSTKLDCTVAFRCDSVAETCEAAYDSMSCDVMCDTYASTATCGFERCTSDADCFKAFSCPIIDPQSRQPTGTFFDCELPFTCDQGAQLCDVRSTATQESLCAFECLGLAPVGG